MYRHLMVALDNTPLSLEAVSRAVELARATGARVTFFHATRGEETISTAASDCSSENAGSSAATAGDARVLFAKAEAVAREARVPCTSLAVRGDRPYEAILDAAETQECDLICMASHGPAGVKGLMLGSQTQKVLQHTTIPVLVSVVENNISKLEHVNPVRVIRGEHRSLAMVLRGLEYLVRDNRERHTRLHVTLLQAMLDYINAFPEKLHHPKEDAYLFRKLRERTPEFNDTLDQLERQHIEGHILISDLEQSLAHYRADPAKGLAQFAAAVQRFAAMQWQHMSLEQKVIIPAAQKHLTAEDWAEIECAFAQNGDPRFSVDADEECKQLFSDILALAPKGIFDGP
jgi:nucleotide-binding universal stress UspA family protein/hemerythrin-like domain-containing protein